MIDKSLDKYALGIIAELSKPENADLLVAVATHKGDFGVSFQMPETMDYPRFIASTYQIDLLISQCVEAGLVRRIAPIKTMEERYADYVKKLSELKVALNIEQSRRFESILALYDDGWSGGQYGCIMTRVWSLLNENATERRKAK